MVYQVVTGGAQAAIVGSVGSQEVINTFNFTHAAGWGQAELDALTAAIDGWVNTSWRPLMAQDYHYVRTEARDLRGPVGFASVNTSHAGVGAIASNSAPNNVSLSIKRRSAFIGRSARGRIYLPPPPLTKVASDLLLDATWVNLVVTALNGIESAVGAVDWGEVIVSRTGSGTSPTLAVVYTLVEYVVVNYAIDSMRRRLLGRGS